ncbi:NADP-dependent oxidoreductase domain-containing protein [Irpex lacteus]|nr:NADP-dependent oxidoreductase domain-containing protein [Irpex lacteus]
MTSTTPSPSTNPSSMTVTLNDGTTMPTLIYGTGTSLREKDASHAVSSAILAGYRHIDCAQMYANESSVGLGLSSSITTSLSRADLYITTKILAVPEGLTVSDTLRDSLKKMQLEYVDMCLIHVPVGHRDLGETWKGLVRAREEGLCRNVGVSNFGVEDLEVIVGSGEVPAVNQIEFHPYVYKACKPLLEYMKERGIQPVTYCGLAPINRVDEGPLVSILPAIAQRLSTSVGETVSPGQVLQLWLRKQGLPYISTTWKEERLKEYLRVPTLPDITDDDEKLITEAGSTVHYRFFVRDHLDA